MTNDRALAERVRRLRNGGQTSPFHHQEAGINSRLDELQAAVLRARLPFLPEWTARRRALAAQYRVRLASASVTIPDEADNGHVYHLFVVRTGRVTGRDRRAELQRHLKTRGIEALVHYPVPIPRQPALATVDPTDCPRAAAVCDDVLSLPLHPGLTEQDLARIAATVAEFPGKDRTE